MTRVVCVSDLHENWIDTPPGDILLIAGDITYGFKHDYPSQQKAIHTDFYRWAMEQPQKHKVVIAGNHDQSVEAWGWPIQNGHKDSIWYLQDYSVMLEGLKIWGTPWQPWFYNWAFNAPERNGEVFLADKFDQIPFDTDIIICHGPPYGYGDHEPVGMYADLGYRNDTQPRLGSTALLNAMYRVQPKLLVCGHIHAGAGTYPANNGTTVVNAAVVNNKYEVVHEPVVIDL